MQPENLGFVANVQIAGVGMRESAELGIANGIPFIV